MSRCWAILTGAYPPAPGGVGDYTRVVARALAAAGDEVHVITPSGAGDDDSPVRVHVIDGVFTMLGTHALGDTISRLPPRREILVQYTPYALGDGTWDERRDELGDTVLRTVDEVAPGLSSLVTARMTTT